MYVSKYVCMYYVFMSFPQMSHCKIVCMYACMLPGSGLALDRSNFFITIGGAGTLSVGREECEWW